MHVDDDRLGPVILEVESAGSLLHVAAMAMKGEDDGGGFANSGGVGRRCEDERFALGAVDSEGGRRGFGGDAQRN